MRRAPVLAVAALLLAPLVAATSPADAGPVRAAADPSPYHATIQITDHGIPHITADDWGSLGYGSGYAVADSSICNLADTLLTARGERSKYLGPNGRYADMVTPAATNLEVDAFVTDLHNRHVVEDLLASPAGPSERAKQMVDGYVAGINRWIEDNAVTDPACAGAPWITPTATSLDLWYGVYMANLIASSGQFISAIVGADPATLDDPGLPVDLPNLPTNNTQARSFATKVNRDKLLRALGHDSAFGSNATAIGGDDSSTGRGLLLGNPHFPWAGRYRFTQQQLTIPGQYDVAGASLIGSPVVNIGWNKDVAWSHTVSTAYRFTPYEYFTPGPGTTYLSANGVRKQAEHRFVDVQARQPDGSIATVHEDLYRTPQGYVIDAPSMFMGWTAASFWAIRDANAEHLRTIDTFLNMGEATDVRDLLRRQDAGGGMPWVNTTAADSSGNALYADHSVVPNVTNALATRCMTPVGLVLKLVAGLPGLNGALADGACKWGTDPDAQRPGIFGDQHLPDVVTRTWVMNANDSFWTPNNKIRLEGYPDIIGCEKCVRTMRTRMVQQYVVDRLKQGKETPATLRGHEYENRVRAGEIMRAGGKLDQVCAQTGETQACAVLKAWDGHSDASSVGYQIFEAFVTRAPTGTGLWSVPFQPRDPLNTPRTMKTGPKVVAAMKAAINAVRNAGVAFDATWGSLQVAGDRGAPAYPLGGGDGDLAGNANALASRLASTNTDRYKPVTYGSSHIQAISFLADGSVLPRTILTYSQYEDPTSPWSSDQTQLYSQEQWVDFPWTPTQVQQQLVRTIDLQGS
ncbi:penicillin acylase family protein [Nocardioides sp. MH1]|uniref:penicillin acylase family protein n=1 Tax=Nocardioides sp. MH1 TaxID=3242490 RepID=UPI003522E3EC